MLWAGAATLTIRESRKSTAGKTLERAFLRAAPSILGLEEGLDYWMNMQRDAEAPREIYAEIGIRRGRIRVEMGLIAQGNQEVIEDKNSRVGARGMVIFDNIGPRSSARRTAADNHVAFIQIRNNRPLEEMYNNLKDLVNTTLVVPPAVAIDIRARIEELPDSIFISVS